MGSNEDVLETIIMFPGGDVVLEVGQGDDKVRLLVLSGILVIASPVFKAMFTEGFSEDENLSSAAPRTIPMPDDRPATVTLLCQFLFLKGPEVPEILDVEQLLAFAILCDKYDCAGAVKPWSMVWIAHLIENAGQKGFEQLICASYVLDLPREFNKVTLAHILHYPGPLSFDTSTAIFRLVPVEIVATLRTKKATVQGEVTGRILLGVSSLMRYTNACSERIVGQYFNNLNRSSLSSCNNNCRYGSSYMNALVEDVRTFNGSAKGLCLDCIKNRNLDDKPACRYPAGH